MELQRQGLVAAPEHSSIDVEFEGVQAQEAAKKREALMKSLMHIFTKKIAKSWH